MLKMVELGRMLDTELRLPTPGSSLNRDTLGRSKTPGSIDMNATANSHSGLADKSADRSDVLAQLERIQNFEEAFNKIKSATGISDIEELVKTFIKNEDHNFSLFNYVNEQNNEVEKLEEQIQALLDEERKYAQESGDDAHQHKQILKELEVKLQSSESMSEKYEIRAQDLQRAVESLKRGIQNIYEKLGVDEDGFGEPLVTESNMVHYLGLIEQKANQILQQYSEAREALAISQSPTKSVVGSESELFSPSKSLVSVLGAGPKIPMGQELLHVNPPKLDEYQSDDEDFDDGDDTRPFTREELKAKTLNRLQRQGRSGPSNSVGVKGKGSNPLQVRY
jgi:uncharacterized phage infection (PIP) family protein YhgE